jgi:hypothetical protein
MTKISDLLFVSEKEIGQREIFHYTSVESFFNIIKNRSLRLSSSKYLNDSQELKIIRELINEENLDKWSIKYDKNRISEIEQLINNNETKETFIISFSKHQDLLSQWRGYADNSKGVSIGFDVNRLRERLIEHLPKSMEGEDLSRILMKPVIYEVINQCEELRVNEFVKNEKRTISILSTSFWLNSLASLFKSESFKEEDEIRIVYNPQIYMTNEKVIINGPLPKLDYFHKNGALKPYFEIDFKSSADIISSVTIGANSKLTIPELKRFFVNNGISIKNIKISQSNLSYRIDG